MKVTQCDNCRTLGPATPIGWLSIAVYEAKAPRPDLFIFDSSTAKTLGTFCGWECVAEYSTARALLKEPSEGGT